MTLEREAPSIAVIHFLSKSIYLVVTHFSCPQLPVHVTYDPPRRPMLPLIQFPQSLAHSQ